MTRFISQVPMFGFGIPELIVIAAIAVIFFGAKKLPELAAGLAKAIKGFKREIREVKSGLESDNHLNKQ